MSNTRVLATAGAIALPMKLDEDVTARFPELTPYQVYHHSSNSNDVTIDAEIIDKKNENYMDAKFQEVDIVAPKKSEGKKSFFDKLKNGSPANKALLLLVCCPKGSLLLAPVIFRKVSTQFAISQLTMGLMAGRLVVGLATWLLVRKMTRSNLFIQKKLLTVANFG